MKIKQVRNATLLVEFGERRFLVDPFLADQGAYPGIPGTANSEKFNPLVSLKTNMEEILAVDAVIVTHTHPDHWDEAAKSLVPKHLPLFVQNEQDAAEIRQSGFDDVRVMSARTDFAGTILTMTPGQHGSDEAMKAVGHLLGKVCGVVFRHPQEKTLYIAGDTVWNDHVAETLAKFDPAVIVLNCGDAQIPGLGSIIMNKDDVATVYREAPNATILASHMEAVNHCLLSRDELRSFAAENGMLGRVLVPDDDQSVSF